METEDLSLDRISNLPSCIIENILCLVPIQEAARTSILSKDWRYNWTKIPKLVFDANDMFFESSFDAVVVFEEPIFEAIHQVLLLHQGPIFEFSLLMENEDGKYDEIDQMVFVLARNKDTLMKLTLRLPESCCNYQEFPLYIYSLHRLTDLYITGICFVDKSTVSGFDSLTNLYIQGEIISQDSLLNLLSSCPSLKHFELVPSINIEAQITIVELFKCLPRIEHLTLNRWNMKFKCDRVPGKHPTAFVHLKYFCLKNMLLSEDWGLRQLGFVMRNSPNLEKIKLEIAEFKFHDDGTKLVTLKDCSDVWLEHLKELEIVGFAARKGEMVFLKLILAKSPVLMKVRIILRDEEVTKDEELEIMRILLGSPHASSLAEITVDRSDGARKLILGGPEKFFANKTTYNFFVMLVIVLWIIMSNMSL